MNDQLFILSMFIVGLFAGAWLYGRGRSGLSPLPRILPERKPPEKSEDDGHKYAKVKP